MSRAFLDFQHLRTGNRKLQADGNIVGDMITADRQNAAVTNSPVVVDQVIGGASPDVDDKNPQIFLVLGHDHLSASKRTQDDILDLEVQLLDTAEVIGDPGLDPVDDMKVGLELESLRVEGIDHVAVSIQMVGLQDRMKEGVRRW